MGAPDRLGSAAHAGRAHRRARGRRVSSTDAFAAMWMSIAVALLGTGCGGSDFSSPPSAGEVDIGRLPRVTSATAAAATAAPVDTGDTDTGDTTDTAPSTDDPVASSAAVQDPAVGIPGVGDPDQLCSSWSQIVGTRHVLMLVADFGDVSSADLGRLEVIAAPLVQRATLEFAGALLDVDAAAIADERDVVFDDLLGPLDRRAASAVAALAAAGAGRDEGILFAQVWLDGLGRFGPDDVAPSLADLGPQLGPLVDRATATFLGEVEPFADDAALDISAVSAPATLGLLADRCPDLSAFGVGAPV